MTELQLPFFYKGFALCNYYYKPGRIPDELTGLIHKLKATTITPPENNVYKGWTNWLYDAVQATGLKYDVVLSVLGCDEIKMNKHKPMYVITRKLSVKMNAVFAPEMIVKTKATLPQRAILPISKPTKREENIAGSFAAGAGYKNLRNLSILIIDDVFATGATLKEIGKTLHSENASNTLSFITLAADTGLPNQNEQYFLDKYFS